MAILWGLPGWNDVFPDTGRMDYERKYGRRGDNRGPPPFLRLGQWEAFPALRMMATDSGRLHAFVATSTIYSVSRNA